MSQPVFLLNGFEALGTLWYLEIFEVLSEAQQEKIRGTTETLLISFDQNYSRFNETSLLATLNTQRVVLYDEHLAKMLHKGEELHAQTAGVFNLFIKDALEAKGYGQKKKGAQEYGMSGHSPSTISITEESISILGDTSIDLGGLGKGYVIDLIATMLISEYGVKEFLINGGGDMYMTHNQGEPIEVFLQHPQKSDEMIGSLLLKNKAFCSSSSYMRMWGTEEKMCNHFISPTQEEVWAASFVVGETALVTDALATVLCITSSDEYLSSSLTSIYDVTYLTYLDDGTLFGTLTYKSL